MSSLDKRETGSIKWYNHTKGYGFIKPDSSPGSGDLFFHVSGVVRGWECFDLSPGDDVEYSVETDVIGRLRAVQVTRRKGTYFACGKVGHHGIDTSPGQSVTRNSRGKWGHMARGWGKKCFDCGQVGHIAVHCPRRQASSSLGVSDVGDERHHGRPGGDGAASTDDEDDHCCVIPENNRFARRKMQTEVSRKLIQNLINEFSDIPGYSELDERHHGRPGGDGAAGTDDEDDDDCVILENNPFVHRKMQTKVWRKLIQNLIVEFSDMPSERICKCEVDANEEETYYDCVPLKNKQQDQESDDDCIVLEKNPFEEDVHETIINMSSKLSLTSRVGTLFSVQQPSDSKMKSLKEGLDHDGLVIVAEKGQVACRDYPHSRHLCVKYPFKDTLHHIYCNLCYCYVCDIKAPCKYWETENDGHCHASEQEFKWIEMRVLNRTKCP